MDKATLTLYRPIWETKLLNMPRLACAPKNDGGIHDEDCQDAFSAAFPTVMKKNLSPMQLCDRQKRDVHFSDDPTEEDFQIFKETAPQLQSRFRRTAQAEHMSKEKRHPLL